MTEFTGERVIPGQVDADLWAEHLSRYRFAAHMARNFGVPPAVLDIGCGAGYGTAALAETASSATGIDLSPEAIEYARSHYESSHLRFVPGSAMSLPFDDASFDLITAFEVIEHLADGKQLLAEARRVMRPGGAFLVSTPNTTFYAETRGKQGPNPYHLHEFTFEEFGSAVAAVFPCSVILLQNHIDAFAFYDSQLSRPIDGYFETASGGPSDAHFFLAVCSREPLASLRDFIYVPAATNLLRDRARHIELLKDELGVARGERDSMMQMYDEQSEQLETQARWARKLDQDLKDKAVDLKTVVDALDAAENTVIERTQWAQRLGAELTAWQEKLHRLQTSRWVRLGRKLGLSPQVGGGDIGQPKPGDPKINNND